MRYLEIYSVGQIINFLGMMFILSVRLAVLDLKQINFSIKIFLTNILQSNYKVGTEQ